MSLRSSSGALAELVQMTSGALSHQWVIWRGRRWIFSSFDGGRTGLIATEEELLLGAAGGDCEASGGMVLLDGRIAYRGKVVGLRDDITFTGKEWS